MSHCTDIWVPAATSDVIIMCSFLRSFTQIRWHLSQCTDIWVPAATSDVIIICSFFRNNFQLLTVHNLKSVIFFGKKLFSLRQTLKLPKLTWELRYWTLGQRPLKKKTNYSEFSSSFTLASNSFSRFRLSRAFRLLALIHITLAFDSSISINRPSSLAPWYWLCLCFALGMYFLFNFINHISALE